MHSAGWPVWEPSGFCFTLLFHQDNSSPIWDLTFTAFPSAPAPAVKGLPKQPAFDPFGLSQEGDACKVCQLVRLTFEPPSLYCFGCAARVKRNQVGGWLGGWLTRRSGGWACDTSWWRRSSLPALGSPQAALLPFARQQRDLWGSCFAAPASLAVFPL